jgi:SAM-dependent methyltransferase
MRKEDQEWINERYSTRIKEENYSYEALRTGPWERRELRFDVLAGLGIETGSKVLDLGCGYGDLSDYFERKGIEIDYTGYDINPDFIEFAKQKYPDKKFEICDIINQEFPQFDYIVSSTCFNLKLKHQDNYEFVKQLLNSMHKHANKGLAIDFMTSYVDFERDIMFHYEPEKVFSIAKGITNRVTLRHDYPLFEFCIYMYPKFEGWAK